MRLKASTEGLEIIKLARHEWTDARWCREASKLIAPDQDWETEDCTANEIFASGCSIPTLKNFLAGKPISSRVFQSFCQVRDIDWQEVIDLTSNTQIQKQAQQSSFIESFWVGRDKLISQLTVELQKSTRVLVLTGITGIGKTALAYQLAQRLQIYGFKCNRPLNFDDDVAKDFTSVVAELLIRWGEAVNPDDRKDPEQLLNRFLQRLQNNNYLIQFDSIEMLLNGDEKTGWNNFQEQYQGNWWVKFFQKLLALSECKSRMILTSQDLPTEFQEMGSAKHQHFEILTGLELPEQLALFRKTGIEVEPTLPSKVYLERIGLAYEGHPLALLVIAGEIMSEPFNGDVVAYWKKYRREIEEIEQTYQQEEIESENDRLRLERFTPRLRELVRKKVEISLTRLKEDFPNAYLLLCMSSVYRRSVPKEAWFAGLEKRLGYQTDQLLIALEALGDRYLIEMQTFIDEDEEVFRQHNLIRSVTLSHLKKIKIRK